MERSPLSSLAALAVVAVLAMALMWLFALNQVTDTGVAGAAAAIDETFARSLEPGTKTRVTMVRDGTGVAAARRYAVRMQPSRAVGSDRPAVARLSERAARVVLNNVSPGKGEVFVHCAALLPDGTTALFCYRRTGVDHAWDLDPVIPAPAMPSAAAPVAGPAGGDADAVRSHGPEPAGTAPMEGTRR
ncbi:MAG: hypothetical protein K8T90_00365 [Planctomycetes bacterium]|nr:hypothetical protein [Planctomycetota bacterium]